MSCQRFKSERFFDNHYNQIVKMESSYFLWPLEVNKKLTRISGGLKFGIYPYATVSGAGMRRTHVPKSLFT